MGRFALPTTVPAAENNGISDGNCHLTRRETTSLIRKALRVFGVSARRGRHRSHAYDTIHHGGDFADYFQKTEGMVKYQEASLLYDLARQTHDGCIVEVGSYRGRSTVALGRGSLDGHRVPVFAIDPHENYVGIKGGVFGAADRGAFYQAMIDTSCYQVVRLINLSSEMVTPRWTQKIGLLWIDGDHTYEGVRRDFECWSPHLLPDAPIAFDDSQDKDLGPHQLIAELQQNGAYYHADAKGKVTVLKRTQPAHV